LGWIILLRRAAGQRSELTAQHFSLDGRDSHLAILPIGAVGSRLKRREDGLSCAGAVGSVTAADR
jgi:hypothetical protein